VLVALAVTGYKILAEEVCDSNARSHGN